MLNEEIAGRALNLGKRVGEKAVLYALRVSKEGLKKLVQLMQTDPEKLLEMMQEPGREMSVKELLKKDQGAKSVDISELGIGDFKPIARKYGMDFAVVKSKYLDPPKFTVFFRSRDADTIETVMSEYSAKCMAKKKERPRPSLRKALQKLKAIVAATPRKNLEKHKEVER